MFWHRSAEQHKSGKYEYFKGFLHTIKRMLVIYLKGDAGGNERKAQNTYSMSSEISLQPSANERNFFTSEQYTPIVDTVYSCEICDKAFNEKKDLQRHYSFHIVRKPFVCKKCESSFMRESALTMHRCPADVVPIKVHTEVPKPSMHAKRSKPESEKPYICEVCDVKFICKSNLKIHLKKNKCITAYNCTICRCNFKQLSTLARHHNRIHLGVDLKEDPEENSNKCELQPDLPHTCEVCGRKFSKKVYLMQHLPVHKGQKELIEFQENLGKEESLVNSSENKEFPNMCEICGKKFSKKYDILWHMSTHTGEKAYKCDVCDKHYISKSTLKVHKRRFHSGVRPYPCDMCPKAFLRKRELEIHYFIHKRTKPYTCGNCKTGFCHRKSLERHIHMQTCVGAPQNTSFENTKKDKSDNYREESNTLNASDSDDINFDWPQSDKRRTRSRTALIARQKANLKALKRLSKNCNGGFDYEKSEDLKETHDACLKHQETTPLVGKPNTNQQYYSPHFKKGQTSNVSNFGTNHFNTKSSINTDVISFDEESYTFSCNLCFKAFESKQGLLTHYSVHSKGTNSSKQETKIKLGLYSCITCGLHCGGKCFRLEQDLTTHLEAQNPVKDYICVDCNLSFDDEYNFSSHACKDKITDVTTFENFFAEQEKQNEEYKYIIHEENDLYACSMCSKSFELEKDLKSHLSSHALNKGFFCNKCPKAFYLEKDLENHVSTHSKKKTFACKVCPEDFNTLKKLNSHLLKHWSSGFICKHCHKGFDAEEDLKNHVDECPLKSNFVCNVCQKSFLLKCALVSHTKSHQREKKQFACKVCSKLFCSNVDLKQHLKSHSGEKCHFCQECGKGYSLKASLRSHLRYHSGRPHACSLCDKKYVCKRDLDIHFLKHTDGVASYICDACGQGFALEKALEKHQIDEHGKTFKKGTKKKKDISPYCSEVEIL